MLVLPLLMSCVTTSRHLFGSKNNAANYFENWLTIKI